jgi:hypothetical protein
VWKVPASAASGPAPDAAGDLAPDADPPWSVCQSERVRKPRRAAIREIEAGQRYLFSTGQTSKDVTDLANCPAPRWLEEEKAPQGVARRRQSLACRNRRRFARVIGTPLPLINVEFRPRGDLWALSVLN